MPHNTLHWTVRTPHDVVQSLEACSIRAPAETGQVGLRPRMEPLVLAIEPGLVTVRTAQALHFVGTVGGLLKCDGQQAQLLTPLAVIGDDEQALLEQLDQLLLKPDEEMQTRAMLGELENRILTELRHDRPRGMKREGEEP